MYSFLVGYIPSLQEHVCPLQLAMGVRPEASGARQREWGRARPCQYSETAPDPENLFLMASSSLKLSSPNCKFWIISSAAAWLYFFVGCSFLLLEGFIWLFSSPQVYWLWRFASFQQCSQRGWLWCLTAIVADIGGIFHDQFETYRDR